MKIRLKEEDNFEPSTICRQLKLPAEDGKMRETDCADTEGIFRIIQSIPSPKAEPFKRWLAKVGYERVQEIEDPELATKRTRTLYKLKGYSEDWIEKRIRGIAIRGDKFLISINSSGGGTGRFTRISWYQIKEDRLIESIIAGEGDRCNGGIEIDGIKNNLLYFSVSATPPDIIEIGAPGTVDSRKGGVIRPYYDLESSAGSCFGNLNYTYDLNTETETLNDVDFNTDNVNENSDWTNEYTYQSCFDEIYDSYINEKKTKLKLDELKIFTKRFFDECQVKGVRS